MLVLTAFFKVAKNVLRPGRLRLKVVKLQLQLQHELPPSSYRSY